MSSKICVTEIPQRKKKKGRNNIFRDNSSEFSKKNQTMAFSTHLRSPANPKGNKENYTKENNKKAQNER